MKEEGMTDHLVGELDIEKSFPNGSIEDYEINEFFPQITVPIKSLASDC